MTIQFTSQFLPPSHVCHLRDIEQEGYRERIKRILNETDPVLADIDGARLALERNYNQQNFAEALATFADTRRGNVAQLGKATPDDSHLVRRGLATRGDSHSSFQERQGSFRSDQSDGPCNVGRTTAHQRVCLSESKDERTFDRREESI